MLPVHAAVLLALPFLRIRGVGIRWACSFLPTGAVRGTLSDELLIIHVKSLAFDPVIPSVCDYGTTDCQQPKYPALAGQFPRFWYMWLEYFITAPNHTFR